ncbi:MAG: lysophospholipid acyltransferase family protein [Bacteroidales bacterium]|jgi:1-acyl-sn-glycerol-3-phosphate acyltransferase
MMDKGYFESGTYDTPDKVKLSFMDRLRLNNRFYFTIKYAQIVFSTRREAKAGTYDDKAWEDSSFFIFKFIEKTGGRFHISGMENIARETDSVVFICNHMSTLETMILPSIISPHRKVTFVVKESLVSHPLFGDVMRSRNPIVVGRKDPRKDLEAVMDGGMELLSKGISVIIFPQSTRSLHFKPEDFNSLGVKLARKAGVKVVPVALKTDYWGNGKIIKELGPIDINKPIYFRFGEPFAVSGTGREDNLRIINFIMSSLAEWETDKEKSA